MRGNRIGRHYAGPHWEANDGSKIVGTPARITYTADYYFFTAK
jgi:hypothetical protein